MGSRPGRTPARQENRAEKAGAALRKQTANAVTWSNAVQIGGSIGIDLSASTGFTTETKIHWTFASAGYLCGNVSSGWPASSQVVGKK